jgi:hypothetical protein
MSLKERSILTHREPPDEKPDFFRGVGNPFPTPWRVCRQERVPDGAIME